MRLRPRFQPGYDIVMLTGEKQKTVPGPRIEQHGALTPFPAHLTGQVVQQPSQRFYVKLLQKTVRRSAGKQPALFVENGKFLKIFELLQQLRDRLQLLL